MSFAPQILHLCYELVAQMHAQTGSSSTTLPKVRFWTEQLKRAHMIRYGSLGNDIHHVRQAMQHSRVVLRQTNGWKKVTLNFL